MDKSRTLRIILKPNGNSLYIYDVAHFSLPHNEDYWVVEKANGYCVFINKAEVAVIGFQKDIG